MYYQSVMFDIGNVGILNKNNAKACDAFMLAMA